MPVKVPDNLPAKRILQSEGICFAESLHTDSVKVAILNLMPKKMETEVQLLRLIGNTPQKINVTLLRMDSHTHKNTSAEYLEAFYKSIAQVKSELFDGLVITGAPVENMAFEEVTYWRELQCVLDWSKTNVTSVFHICWGAQAALYHHYGIKKYPLGEKLFGVFSHRKYGESELLRGFDDEFFAPHSRYTTVNREDIEEIKNLKILADSAEAGVYIAASADKKQIFVTGHSEYDRNTLLDEYRRDLSRGINIAPPKNYFQDDKPGNPPTVRWKAHGVLLFGNWINYCIL